MIQITLSFDNISAARKAMLELPESLLAGASVAQEDRLPAEPKKEAPAKKEAAKPAAAATPTTAETTAAPEPKVESSAPAAIEYPVLQKAVFALAAKSREAATALVATFGVKTFKELPAEKWAEALAAVNAKLAEA